MGWGNRVHRPLFHPSNPSSPPCIPVAPRTSGSQRAPPRTHERRLCDMRRRRKAPGHTGRAEAVGDVHPAHCYKKFAQSSACCCHPTATCRYPRPSKNPPAASRGYWRAIMFALASSLAAGRIPPSGGPYPITPYPLFPFPIYRIFWRLSSPPDAGFRAVGQVLAPEVSGQRDNALTFTGPGAQHQVWQWVVGVLVYDLTDDGRGDLTAGGAAVAAFHS